jgi:hypothetical protein
MENIVILPPVTVQKLIYIPLYAVSYEHRKEYYLAGSITGLDTVM